jgi:drug/metabolite transporter (DMT)-like permease
MKSTRLRADLGLAAVCLIWGSTFVLVKSALEDISTVLFLALRFTVATLALATTYGVRKRPWRLVDWRAGLVLGVFLYLGYLLQTLGLRYTTPAKSGFITGLYIVLVPLFSSIIYKKVPGFSEWMGIALASIGLGLLTLDTASLQIGLGDLLTVGCAFAFAVHIVLLGHNSQRSESDWLAMLQVGVCAILASSSFWWFESPFVRWSSAVVAAIAVTSILATAVAFWIQTWAQKYTTATRAALVFSLEPVFAWITSYLVADERLTGRAMAGAACILAGILLVELKPLQTRSHQIYNQ